MPCFVVVSGNIKQGVRILESEFQNRYFLDFLLLALGFEEITFFAPNPAPQH